MFVVYTIHGCGKIQNMVQHRGNITFVRAINSCFSLFFITTDMAVILWLFSIELREISEDKYRSVSLDTGGKGLVLACQGVLLVVVLAPQQVLF